ncbi:MAG: hypothetical protein JW908_03705 [Anaerolineales bacterium]|nr:hypothetical protein [Anaerolineales bacterium]
MKNNPFQMISIALLSVLFFTTIFTLTGVENNSNAANVSVHTWAGALLLIGAAVHLKHKSTWIKSVLSRPTKTLPRRTRQNRAVALGMVIMGVMCTLTGVLGWISPIERITRLHTFSGVVMIFLIGAHMLLHWSWLIRNIRQLFSPPQNQAGFSPLETLSTEKK